MDTETVSDVDFFEASERQETSYLDERRGAKCQWSTLPIRYPRILLRCCTDDQSIFIIPTQTSFKYENRRVELKDVPAKGKGVFAKRDLDFVDTFIYYGKQILQTADYDEGDYVMNIKLGRSGDKYRDDENPLQMFTNANPDFIEAYDIPLMFASRVNEPSIGQKANCEFVQVWDLDMSAHMDDHNNPLPSLNPYDKHVILQPIRNINAGEELLADYGALYPRKYETPASIALKREETDHVNYLKSRICSGVPYSAKHYKSSIRAESGGARA